ncbi:MAG: hypothetical protein ACLFTT_18495 [Candidatus Hydrogenedentota bacterium]
MTPAAVYARGMFFRQVLIESAGLFWIGAEVAILFGVLLARRHLAKHAHEPHLRFTAQDWWCGGLLLAGFLVLAGVVIGRHGVLVQPHHLIAQGASPAPEALAACYEARHREHLVVWAGFVTLWVLLEAVIVYHGWRAYRVLRRVLGHGGRRA